MTTTMLVHIPKTAGRSMDTALRKALGNRDHVRRQHATAWQLREHMPQRFEAAFVFAFVRNPWAQVVSWWRHYRASNHPHYRDLEFREWVLGGLSHPVKRETSYVPGLAWHEPWDFEEAHPLDARHYLCDEDGEILVDFVGCFERLDKGWQEVCSRAGVDAPLPHEGATEGPHWREMYDEETRAIVGERFAWTVETFGYDFEQVG